MIRPAPFEPAGDMLPPPLDWKELLLDEGHSEGYMDAQNRVHHGMVWHYTDLAGFLGIVESGTIWATDHRFLNDRKEFQFGTEYSRAAIDGRVRQPRANDDTDFLARLRTGLMREPQSQGSFVTSFSALPDDLNQWRAYGQRAGVCMGFDVRRLLTLASTAKMTFVPCVYSHKRQLAFVDSIIDRVQNEMKGGVGQDEAIARFKIAVETECVPAFKHEAFAAEREWRLVSEPIPEGDPRRTSGSRRFGSSSKLIPYIRVPLLPPEIPDGIDMALVWPASTVVISPTLSRDYQNAVDHILSQRCGISDCRYVTDSEVPYRSGV